MRVCLIIPPSSFLLDERVFPALGILKVAAVLDQSGVPVRVIDLSGERDYLSLLESELAFDISTAYGVTATMPQMPQTAAIARTIREHRPDARLILGGPHPTLMNASARHERQQGIDGRACAAMRELHAMFDVVVAGDGEKTIGLALAPNAPALIDADDPASSLFLTKADLNEAPFPARHLIDIQSYRYQIDGVATMSMIAQLGCPFGCTFCGGRRSPFLRRVRMRSTDRVIEEMRHLFDTYGAHGFMFLDDELNVNPEFMGLLDRMIALQAELGTTFRLRGLVKSELVTEAMATAMYRAGFRQLLIGFESGDERMLLNMNKHATRADNTRCVQRLKAAGIRVKALMSIGHAGESLDSIDATREWLLEVQPDDFDVTIITVYPGTPYYDDAIEAQPGVWTYTAPKTGDRLHAYRVDQLTDANFYKGIPGAYQSFVYTDTLTAGELVTARDRLEQDVREQLGIPWPIAAAELQYEHSMGAR